MNNKRHLKSEGNVCEKERKSKSTHIYYFVFYFNVVELFFVFKENEKYGYEKSNMFASQQHYYNKSLSSKQKIQFFLRVINGIGKN